MSQFAVPAPARPSRVFAPLALTGPFVCVGLGVLAAGLILVLGLWALLVPVYIGAVYLALFRPERSAAALLFVGIAVESNGFDFTNVLGHAIYELPPPFRKAFFITTSPFELLIWLTAVSVALTRPSRVRVPAIVWAVPFVVGLGMVYGVYKGGAANLAYNEARGLFSGIAVFIIVLRIWPKDLARVTKVVLLAEVVYAAITVTRYFAYVRTGNLKVPVEFAFSHEGAVILGVGLLIGATLFVQHTHDARTRVALLAYCLLVLAAMFVSARRAATLVLLVGAVSMGTLLLPRRGRLVILPQSLCWSEDPSTLPPIGITNMEPSPSLRVPFALR